jgi:hypothetical protein
MNNGTNDNAKDSIDNPLCIAENGKTFEYCLQRLSQQNDY